MEQAYATVGQATVHLVSGAGGDVDHAKNLAILRSTLQQRPVTLGFVLSTFARRLREGAAGGQSSQDSAGSLTALPHVGIRLALEVVLGSSYDPSTPHAAVCVVDALGEDRLELLLHAPGGGEGPLLPWAARLCLLHACLAAGNATARRWGWLPVVADSASSLALQEIATKGASGSVVGNGVGRVRARAPPPNEAAKHTAAADTGGTEAFPAAVMAQVCGELAAAGLAGSGTASMSSYPRASPGVVADNGLSSVRGAAGLLPGGIASGSFRLKLQSLRDALLCGVEKEREAAEEPVPTAVGTAIGGVGLENLEIHPESVRRALERGRCGGEAFILAVQTALERSMPPNETPEAIGKNASSSSYRSGGRRASVKLKHALEACLFGDGLPLGRGLLDAVALDDRELSFLASPSSSSAAAAAAARTVGTRPSRAASASVPPEARQGCALMQGLVEEGARIRDLVLALLGMHQERERRRPPRARPPAAASTGAGVVDSACRRTGADVVATVRPACDFVRSPLGGVLRAFVEWLADTPWVWGATEGVEGEDWEGDFAAASLAISAVYPASQPPPAAADTGAGIFEAIPTELESPAGGASWGSRCADPTDVLDRLVAGAAMAMGHADASSVEWVDVLQRVASAATATYALRAYAVACVEKSAALGGQAPFRVARMGRRRFSHVRGKELWALLERACGLNGGESLVGEHAPTAVLTRTAAAAVVTSRTMSQSWIISPGLLGSGPLRAVIDMLHSANGRVATSDILDGLLGRPGGKGPALAADFFAAVVATAAAAESGEAGGRDNIAGTGLRSQATAWLGGTLSTSHSPAPPPGGLSMGADSTIAAAALVRHLIRRVPFEAKPVLLAVQETAELATTTGGGRGLVGASTRRSGKKRKHVCGKGEGGSGGPAAVASLLKLGRAAMQSPLLPLPVAAVSSPPPRPEPSESGGTSDARGLSVDGGPEDSPAGGEGGEASPASVTAELLLNNFVQSPAAVRRSIREGMQQGKCDDELRAVQTALRRALCAAPAPSERASGPAAAAAAADDDDTCGISGGGGVPTPSPTPTPVSAGLGARKAPACLLAGYLVESGVPGWEDTKAVMTPPPHPLLEAAEGGPAVRGAPPLHGEPPPPPLTALRLEVWLRSLLCDAGSSRLDDGFDIEKSFPDVFRTARTLARAVARHASSLVADAGRGPGAPPPNGYHPPYSGGGSGGLERLRPYSVNGGARRGDVGGSGGRAYGVVGRLKTPREALVGRLQSSPAAGVVGSWVSSVVKTARQYERWLPWQAFADELRELVLVSVRQQQQQQQQPVHQAEGGGDGDAGGGRALAAEAAVYAVCELLLAWTERGEDEVIAAVFRTALCSRTLSTVAAPVTSDVRPPIWLEVLRCLCDSSVWSSSPQEDGGGVQQDPLTVAAAAAVWIGGDGPGKGLSAERSTREEWVRWYGTKVGPLIPTGGADLRNWLVLSCAAEGSGSLEGGVSIRTGMAGAARTVEPREWENWGRSPLQAAWNFPGEWRARNDVVTPGADADADNTRRPAPPAVVLPPFASWLRVVLRGGPSCPDGLLEAYLRRMAREVYLPCQFNGASGEMARQWLGALIEAEAGAEERARKAATTATTATTATSGAVSNVVAVKTEFSSEESGAGTPSTRRLVVKAFFREELLRFGSGESSAAPVGGPLTWLWPLEAVVAACGKTGPFGGSALARRRRGTAAGPEGLQLQGDAATRTRIALDDPPSALARALSTVPHDLLCGARRFDRGGGQAPPAVATLRAFATRAVDLAARALATPPCRHWSVARRLLLGLGLLYHALAMPVQAAREGGLLRSFGGAASVTGAGEASGGSTPRGDGGASDSQASAQAAALSAIETLVSTALGLGSDDDAGAAQNNSSPASVRVARGTGPATRRPARTLLLTPACLALRPLETGSCVGAVDLAEALRGAGAWRAAAAFFAPRKKATQTQNQARTGTGTTSSADPPSVAEPPRSLAPSSPPLPPPPPPLSPVVDPQPPHHRYSSPGAIPAEDVDRPVGGHRANGRSIADALVVDVEQPGSSAGGHELDADSPRSPSGRCPTTQQETSSRKSKKARVLRRGTWHSIPPHRS